MAPHSEYDDRGGNQERLMTHGALNSFQGSTALITKASNKTGISAFQPPEKASTAPCLTKGAGGGDAARLWG